MKTDKEILLCALNSKFIHSCLSVHSLKKFAESRGYEKGKIIVREFTVNDTLDFIMNGIFRENPAVVAFSVYIWNVEYVSKICKIIKSVSPEIKIILGGPEVSYVEKHPLLDENTFDFVLKGEGEKSFFDLLTTGEITEEKILKLDEIPLPYDEENIHLFENRIVYYESSRGCPFSCAYCLSSAEKGVRFLSLERVKEDLNFFAKHNVRQIKFVDRTFNADKKRAYEIWQFIIESYSDKDMNFHFELAADLLDDDIISLLKTAPKGLIQLEIGIQSTNEETLKLNCRKTDTEKVLSNTEKLVKSGNINIHTDLIAGLPGESLDDFKNSFNEVYQLKSHQLQLGFLKLLHGTEMESISKNFDFVFFEHPPYEVLKNRSLSHKDFLFLKKLEDVFEKIHNSQRFIFSIDFLEKYFENPFLMFEKISEFFEEKNISFASVSTKEIYNLLHMFFKEKICAETKDFDRLLLCDYFLSEKSELVPTKLRYLLPDTKTATEKSSHILRSLGLQKQRGLIVRFIDEEAVIVDYSKRSKINSRFSFTPYSSETLSM